MKTINRELAKKLYEAGVNIPSKKFKKKKGSIRWTDIYGNEIKFPAPNFEEVIEFLTSERICLLIKVTQVYSVQFIINFEIDSGIFTRDALLEALEETLEYLLDNGYIGKIK